MTSRVNFTWPQVLPWLVRCVCWVTAVIFLSAGIPKLFAPGAFAEVVGMYGLLPDRLVSPAAVLLPVLEVVTAVGLLFGRRWAIRLAVLQLLLFIAVLSYGIWLGLDIDCGCFGPEEQEFSEISGLRHALFRDILLLLPLILAWWQTRRTINIRKREEDADENKKDFGRLTDCGDDNPGRGKWLGLSGK